MDENTINLVGNISSAPFRSPGAQDNNFVQFEMITNSSQYDKTIGQRVKTPQLHTVSCKNQAADYVMEYGRVGKRVYVKGEVKYKTEYHNGLEFTRASIFASNIDIPRNEGD